MPFQMHHWVAGLMCQQSWRCTNMLRATGQGTPIVSPPCFPATIRPGGGAAHQTMARQGAAVFPPRDEAGHEN